MTSLEIWPIPIFLVIAILGWWIWRKQHLVRLRDWAKSSGYKLLKVEQRFAFEGPFEPASKSDSLWWVMVEDESGTRRSGLVMFR